MSAISREKRYEMLCDIKRTIGTDKAPASWPKTMTDEEEKFIQEFAQEKFDEIMKDPEVVAVMKRLKNR
jgi:hypothetical protein